jgi:hypothetical protein
LYWSAYWEVSHLNSQILGYQDALRSSREQNALAIHKSYVERDISSFKNATRLGAGSYRNLLSQRNALLDAELQRLKACIGV